MSKSRILIVEDSESAILWYKGVLSSLDIHIDTAASVDQAIDKLKEHDYILHIIDLTLEGDEPGFDLIGRCGTSPESCLIISGTLPEDLVTKLMEVYGIPYEQIKNKPVDAKTLVKLVKSRMVSESSPSNVAEEVNEVDKSNSSDHLQTEKIIAKLLFDYWSQHKLIAVTILIFLTVFLRFGISYLKVDIYNEIYNNIETRNDKKFRHYNESDMISGTTYANLSGYKLVKLLDNIKVEGNKFENMTPLYYYLMQHKEYLSRCQIKFYPNDNYLIVITDGNGTFRHIWISDEKYLNDLGIGQDLTFFDIFIKAWSASFKNF